MNKISKLLLGITGLFFASSFLLKKKAALENIEIKKIDVYIDEAKTRNASFLKLFYRIKLTIYNSAKVSVNIENISGKLFLEKTQFATISKSTKLNLGAMETKIIEIESSVNSLNVISSILNYISEGTAKITVIGELKTDLGIINFTETKSI